VLLRLFLLFEEKRRAGWLPLWVAEWQVEVMFGVLFVLVLAPPRFSVLIMPPVSLPSPDPTYIFGGEEKKAKTYRGAFHEKY
jgi:hypothetical protein